MSVSDKLTNLANVVRTDYLLADKLSIDDMTDLLSGKNDLEKGVGDQPFDEGVDITNENDSYTLTAKRNSSRLAFDVVGKPGLAGETMAIYFQASTNDADGVSLQLGPVGGEKVHVTVKSKTMTGHYTVITFTVNNSLSILFDKPASINIKGLRAWIVE